MEPLFKYIKEQIGVKKRLLMSFYALTSLNFEESLYQLSSVVDSTSKHYYPNEGVGARYKSYLQDNLADLIRLSSLNYKLSILKDDGNVIPIDNLRNIIFDDFSLIDILYKIRNSQFNKKEDINNYITFTTDNRLELNDEKLSLPSNFILGLFLLLLSDPANKYKIKTDDNEPFDKHLHFTHNDISYYLFDYAGERNMLFNMLKSLGNNLDIDFDNDEEILGKRNFSGISKRFIMAQDSLKRDDNEESLYQLLTILEYLAKKHNSTLRNYLISNEMDIYQIHTCGKPVIKGTDIAEKIVLNNSPINDFAYIPIDNYYSPIAVIRNSLYHDPDEVKENLKIVSNETKDLIINRGDTVVTRSYVFALMLIALTDEKSTNDLYFHPDFDHNFSITDNKNVKKYFFKDLIGNREKVLEIFS